MSSLYLLSGMGNSLDTIFEIWQFYFAVPSAHSSLFFLSTIRSIIIFNDSLNPTFSIKLLLFPNVSPTFPKYIFFSHPFRIDCFLCSSWFFSLNYESCICIYTLYIIHTVYSHCICVDMFMCEHIWIPLVNIKISKTGISSTFYRFFFYQSLPYCLFYI